MKYSNLPLDITDIIQQMKSRDLSITDENNATTFLENVSYFRFAAYLRPMEIDAQHNYKSGATFENAMSLYDFDARLRHLIFGAIQKIEISLRAKIINQISLQYGAMWFINSDIAVDKHKFSDNLSTLERELNRSKEEFIKEHINKYGKDEFPPVWKLLELASLGCLTKLYFNFADNKIKKSIARSYKVPQHEILESWMKSINVLRNACAHHSRVWNRVMAVMPQLPNNLNADWITIKPAANKLYAILCCLHYWLNAIYPTNSFKNELHKLLAEYPNVDTSAMGFPTGWENEPLWK
jgi:abortive infection bacteriophage resistance protein